MSRRHRSRARGSSRAARGWSPRGRATAALAALVLGAATASCAQGEADPVASYTAGPDDVDQPAEAAAPHLDADGTDTAPDDVAAGPSGLADPPVPDDVMVGRVVGVSDGDTLRLDVVEPGPGEGLEPGDRIRLRLLRIDSPEVQREDQVGECHAERATDLLAELLPQGTLVRVAYDVEQVDRFGRDLGHAWTPAGRWVNGRMVEAGLAEVVTFRPNGAYDDEVRAREAHAREQGLGIWDPSSCPA